MLDPAGLNHYAISILRWLAWTSLSAAGIAVVILFVQLVFSRWLSAKWRYRLWAILVLRLLLPALPSSPASLANLKLADRVSAFWTGLSDTRSTASSPAPVRIESDIVGHTSPGISVTIEKEPLSPNPVTIVPITAPPPPPRPSVLPLFILGSWLLVAVVLFLRLLTSNLALLKRIRTAESADAETLLLLRDCCAMMGVRKPPDVRITSAVTVPAAAGVFRPRILLPAGLLESLSLEERRTILLHELAHIRRHDVAVNWLLALIQIVHWFNPILWLAFARLRADRELSRDAMVLALSKASDPHDYIQTLLKLTESLSTSRFPDLLAPTPPVAVGMYGGKNGLKRRLHMIVRLPQTRRRFDWTGPALSLILVGALLTSAKSQTRDAGSQPPTTQPTLSQERHQIKVPVLSETPILGRLFTSEVDAPATRPADKQARIDELIRRSRRLTDEGRFSEALECVNEILKMDPANDYGVGVKPLMEDKVQFAQRRQNLKYPTDPRDPNQPEGPDGKLEEAQKKLLGQLDKTLPALTFDAVGFSDVIDFLRDVSGTNIFVNWKALGAAGIDRNTAVSANLRNVKFSKALNVILDSVGGGQVKLGFSAEDGVITISTQADLPRNVIVRVYDIRDLLIDTSDFSGTPDNIKSAPATRPVTREDLVKSITKLIIDTVNSDSWKDRGGSVGALRELEGQLIVTQTPDNHKQIATLLEQLREQRAIQISVEARFVSCDQRIMDELIAAWNRSDSPPAPVNSSNTRPAGTKDISKQPAGIFLNGDQVLQFMKLIQKAPESTITTSPRVTLWNGQRASIKVIASRTYLSGYMPTTKGDGEVRYEPVVKSAEPGILMDVTATVSGDRRFVTLSMHPQVTTLLGFDRVPWAGSPKNVDLMVQEPKIKTSEIRTILSIPDGGSALLSGLEDPNFGVGQSGEPTTRPTASRGIYLLVRPAIIRSAPADQPTFPQLSPKKFNEVER